MLVTGEVSLKVCKDCGETKSLDEFYRSGRYWQPRCKQCHNARSRARYAANPDEIRQKMAEYREKNREQIRQRQAHHTRKWRYKITRERYEELLQAQGGICPGCLVNLRCDVQVDVDHDHGCCPGEYSCGRCVRGLLCHQCNVALGMLQDNPQTLRRLAAYVEPPVD